MQQLRTNFKKCSGPRNPLRTSSSCGLGGANGRYYGHKPIVFGRVSPILTYAEFTKITGYKLGYNPLVQNNATHGSSGHHNILQVPLTSQVLVQARLKINRMLMQCTKQEDRTDPLYMWTGGSSCPLLSRGYNKEERDESETVADQE